MAKVASKTIFNDQSEIKMCAILLLIACSTCAVLVFIIYNQRLDIQKISTSDCKPFFEDEKKPFERIKYKDSSLGEILEAVEHALESYRPINESLSVQLCKKLAHKDVNLDKFFKEIDAFDYETAKQTFKQISQKSRT